MVISKEFALNFAKDWISSWNSHNIDRIIDHYSDSIDFTSPIIIEINNDPNGHISNKIDLKSYFEKALNKYEDLHFELLNVFVSVDSLVIYYKSIKNMMSAEYFQFDQNGKIAKVKAHYSIIDVDA